VEERYFVAAFDAIESEWGSFDRYVSEGLGISAEEIARLRSIYLEPNSA
jgi:protein-tyrosine phosphatase